MWQCTVIISDTLSREQSDCDECSYYYDNLLLFVSYQGMVVDPQQCGILCNTPSSVNSGMHCMHKTYQY